MKIYKYGNVQIYIHVDKNINVKKCKRACKYIETDRQTDRQTGRKKDRQTDRKENDKNYNIKLPRIFILSLLIVSPYLQKDPQTIV